MEIKPADNPDDIDVSGDMEINVHVSFIHRTNNKVSLSIRAGSSDRKKLVPAPFCATFFTVEKQHLAGFSFTTG